jgi:hypothetical protein
MLALLIAAAATSEVHAAASAAQVQATAAEVNATVIAEAPGPWSIAFETPRGERACPQLLSPGDSCSVALPASLVIKARIRGPQAIDQQFWASQMTYRIGTASKTYGGYLAAGLFGAGAGALTYGGIKADQWPIKAGAYLLAPLTASTGFLFFLLNLEHNRNAEQILFRPPGDLRVY